MNQYHEHLHQKSRIIDYRDQISSGLFHIHRILTTYFPDSDISSMIKMQNIVENELQNIMDSMKDSDGVL
jgi:hypothetical protein